MIKSSEKKIYKAMGLMSGTSMDGIDIALIETDGESYVRSLAYEEYPMPDALRNGLRECLNCDDRTTDKVREIEIKYTQENIIRVKEFIIKNSDLCFDIDVIGWHGQTIHHAPDRGVTIQLGCGDMMAEALNIPVVNEFRLADVAAGGQGAPLIPVYHRALMCAGGHELPTAIVNIGGVANVTWLGNDRLIGFDTGPGNAMIDDWVCGHVGKDCDEDGGLASDGVVKQSVVDEFLSLPYFSEKFPKSLDRNDFNQFNIGDLSVADGAATLVEMTVRSIGLGLLQCPEKPAKIYVAGGGRHNKFMMKRLTAVTGCNVCMIDDLGWNGDAIEAEGFAYMAVRKLIGLPISFPETTGCSEPAIGGVLHDC